MKNRFFLLNACLHRIKILPFAPNCIITDRSENEKTMFVFVLGALLTTLCSSAGFVSQFESPYGMFW